ncbi:hypothetical protein [Streptomyces sp. NPDC051218]|uniref:hypothetical protein n=1 Tax=Streptomyces sp. NPDC051218 TaxID=3365645 RepID=UPI0037BCC5FD
MPHHRRLADETPDISEAAARKRALRTGLRATERQVEAIEAYAVQSAEADARLRVVQQIERLEKGGGELFDFLASIARAEVAIEGLDEMPGERLR